MSNVNEPSNLVLAVGGLYETISNQYQETTEVYDLYKDKWKTSAKLKFQRLNPFVIPIGIECALVIGGFTRNYRSLEENLVRHMEIVDVK